MNNTLERQAYKEVVIKRWKFTKVALFCLALLAVAAYASIKKLLPTDAWWFIPLFGLLSFLIHLGANSFMGHLDSISSSYCPKCSKLIEKQQIIGNPMPKECRHCGLRISRI